jgi:hypothetical protein
VLVQLLVLLLLLWRRRWWELQVGSSGSWLVAKKVCGVKVRERVGICRAAAVPTPWDMDLALSSTSTSSNRWW